MKIEIEPHTLLRASERGATKEEIIDTITSGVNIIGKKGRSGKSKIFEFNQLRNGKYYNQKKIEVFYVVESDSIVTVTVYVFYGNFNL